MLRARVLGVLGSSPSAPFARCSPYRSQRREVHAIALGAKLGPPTAGLGLPLRRAPPPPPPPHSRASRQSPRCEAERPARAGLKRSNRISGGPAGSGSAGAAGRPGPRPAPPPAPASPPPPARGAGVRQESDDDEDAPLLVSYVRERVNIQNSNTPLRSLVDKVDANTLNLEPEYQRDFVWDTKKCMKLLKTVYEGLPMPAVMLYKKYEEGVGNRHDVVDGKQRLITLYTFVRGCNERFPRAPTAFKMDPKEEELADLLNGKAFKDLTIEEQNNIYDYDVQVQYIPEDTSTRIVFRIYENINAGGVEHSDMQLRRAPYHGPYIRLLDRLVGGEGKPSALFLQLAALSEEEQRTAHCLQRTAHRPQPPLTRLAHRPQRTMQAHELALRFFALRRAAIPSNKRPFKTPMRTFLNKELASTDAKGREVPLQLKPEEEKEMTEAFERTVSLVDTLGFKAVAEAAMKAGSQRGSSFRRGGGTTGAGIVWDTTLVGLSLALDICPKIGTYTKNAAALQKGYSDMLRSSEWQKAGTTLTQKSFTARLALFKEMVIRPALADDVKLAGEPRAFSRRQAQEAYARDPTCAWCGKPIVDLAHAEADHIVPYSRGGRTSLDNCAMLHMQCNREKGARPQEEGPAARRAAAAAAAASGVEAEAEAEAGEVEAAAARVEAAEAVRSELVAAAVAVVGAVAEAAKVEAGAGEADAAAEASGEAAAAEGAGEEAQARAGRRQGGSWKFWER
ncbi:hypothetical protein TSOC_007772 [Tetrabaena socialis]|uniref:HNH nuclease domain-containing protein n=1 Tax=Tetrabaena socialis TaxID=47790 RepID=A0A2J8A0C4_9CHLO|nr:hypothetical protein TSOC_007772 [Tetrabaena socialis]|eukprot:PNH05928.1 hypothetical protein TSOC_007772 [Tetrabaena socialis]